MSEFGLAFVTQNGLSGHAIPISPETREVLRVLGVISDDEANRGKVPGMERAIPKSKGAEFFSLLHQLGIDYAASPHSSRVRAILLEIAPDAKDRLPKRAPRKAPDGTETAEAEPGPAPESAAPAARERKGKDKEKDKEKQKERDRDQSKPTASDTGATKKVAGKAAAPKPPGGEHAKKTPSKRLAKHKPR